MPLTDDYICKRDDNVTREPVSYENRFEPRAGRQRPPQAVASGPRGRRPAIHENLLDTGRA